MLMTIRSRIAGAMAAGALVTLAATHATAEDGVSADTIVFGQAAVLEGPASALGQGMRTGIQAAFDEINKKGGIHGRKLKLVSIDDGYEPDKSIAAVKKLIEDEKVFALIGPVGTPTANAAQPVAQAAKVPYIGPFTGAGFLRDPKRDNVVNIRAGYDAETEAWVKHLTEDLKITKIAIFYQDDAFGRAGLSGFKKAMDKRGMAIAAEGTFERNTVAVKSALLNLKRAEPEAVVMVGPYKLSLEGYLVGRLTVAALEKAGPNPTREGLLKTVKETGTFDIGGLPMTYGPEKNEGLDKVFMTVIQPDGSFKAVDKLTKMSSN